MSLQHASPSDSVPVVRQAALRWLAVSSQVLTLAPFGFLTAQLAASAKSICERHDFELPAITINYLVDVGPTGMRVVAIGAIVIILVLAFVKKDLLGASLAFATYLSAMLFFAFGLVAIWLPMMHLAETVKPS